MVLIQPNTSLTRLRFLADRITVMPRGALIDGTSAIRIVLSHVGRDLECAHRRYEGARVVAAIRAQCSRRQFALPSIIASAASRSAVQAIRTGSGRTLR